MLCSFLGIKRDYKNVRYYLQIEHYRNPFLHLGGSLLKLNDIKEILSGVLHFDETRRTFDLVI